jgi:aspyridone synthetase (hybrid polyketide synthase/nonribosomal peptide synthetase)
VFQGQIILPGASYIAAVVEAAKVVAADKPIRLIKLTDVRIPKAVVLQENKSTELMTTLRIVHQDENSLSAEFSFAAAQANVATSSPDKTCSGRLHVELGEIRPSERVLPLPERHHPIWDPLTSICSIRT